jgi:hypothetical protein
MSSAIPPVEMNIARQPNASLTAERMTNPKARERNWP